MASTVHISNSIPIGNKDCTALSSNGRYLATSISSTYIDSKNTPQLATNLFIYDIYNTNPTILHMKSLDWPISQVLWQPTSHIATFLPFVPDLTEVVPPVILLDITNNFSVKTIPCDLSVSQASWSPNGIWLCLWTKYSLYSQVFNIQTGKSFLIQTTTGPHSWSSDSNTLILCTRRKVSKDICDVCTILRLNSTTNTANLAHQFPINSKRCVGVNILPSGILFWDSPLDYRILLYEYSGKLIGHQVASPLKLSTTNIDTSPSGSLISVGLFNAHKILLYTGDTLKLVGKFSPLELIGFDGNGTQQLNLSKNSIHVPSGSEFSTQVFNTETEINDTNGTNKQYPLNVNTNNEAQKSKTEDPISNFELFTSQEHSSPKTKTTTHTQEDNDSADFNTKSDSNINKSLVSQDSTSIDVVLAETQFSSSGNAFEHIDISLLRHTVVPQRLKFTSQSYFMKFSYNMNFLAVTLCFPNNVLIIFDIYSQKHVGIFAFVKPITDIQWCPTTSPPARHLSHLAERTDKSPQSQSVHVNSIPWLCILTGTNKLTFWLPDSLKSIVIPEDSSDSTNFNSKPQTDPESTLSPPSSSFSQFLNHPAPHKTDPSTSLKSHCFSKVEWYQDGSGLILYDFVNSKARNFVMLSSSS